MATCNWVMLVGGFVAVLGLPGSTAAQTGGDRTSMTSLDRLRSAAAAGKVKEIDLDRGQLKIADAPPLAAGVERPALMTAAAVPAAPNAVPAAPPPPRRLTAEVNQRLRDLESCRGGARTGQIQLRWRILPDGHTTNALVLEQQPTDMDVMKCARRRIEGWRFLTAAPAPVDVEYAYDFGRTDNQRATAATTPAAEAAARSTVAAPPATATIASDKRAPTANDEPEGKVRARATGPGEAKAGEAKAGEAKLNEARLEEGK